MRLLLTTLTVAIWLSQQQTTFVEAAAVACEDVCEIDLHMNCYQALATYKFWGSCCTLQDYGDQDCFMVTTEDCSIGPLGEPTTVCNEGGCLPNYTLYSSFSDDVCPESEFEIPTYDSYVPSLVPVSDAPSLVDLTDSPTEDLPYPTEAPTYEDTYGPSATTYPTVTYVPSWYHTYGPTFDETTYHTTYGSFHELETYLHFSFFGLPPTGPTTDELDALMMATENFYEEVVLFSTFGDYESIVATVANVMFDPNSAEPLRVDVDFTVFFSTPFGTSPSPNDIYTVMMDADYSEYIFDYVWSLGNDTLWWDVNGVQFDLRSTLPPPNSEAPSMGPILDMKYSYKCYDEWSNGMVQPGKCYALDQYHCVQEWQDGCSEVNAYFDYYNQYTDQFGSSRESYYYVTVNSASGCDPDNVYGQPYNGCTVDVYGDICLRCFNDGDKIVLVDCTNVPTTFDPPENQVIALLKGGDDSSFTVVETFDMCNHPSVVESSDISTTRSGSGLGSDAANEEMLPVDLTVTYSFFDGEGANPNHPAISLLVAETMGFLHSTLRADPHFASCLVRIETLDIQHEYAPDEFTLSWRAGIVVDTSQKSVGTSAEAAHDMAASNLHEYLREHVRRNRSGRRNIFFDVKKVVMKSVGHINTHG